MVRPYLEKPTQDMEQFIVSRVQPKVADRTVISRRCLDDIMSQHRIPATFRALTIREQSTVLCTALRNLGWEKYSKTWNRRANAWIIRGAGIRV